MLLKTLEEASANIVFLLITTRPDKLNSTIISRSWIVRFHPINEVELANFLTSKFQISLQKAHHLIDYFECNLNEILDYLLIESNELEEFDLLDIFRMVWKNELYASMSLLESHNVLQDKFQSLKIISRLKIIIEKLLNVKTKQNSFERGIDNLANLLSMNSLNQISNYLNQAENFIENNVNLRLVWINLLLLIKNAFKK